MARVPQCNEAVHWGPPPDPKNPPNAYPGISAKKFNPLEAQRCYSEAIAKEKDFRSMHQMLSMKRNLPAFLGERPGRRKVDMIPGYGSLLETYETLGYGYNLAGRLEQQPAEAERPPSSVRPPSRPVSAGALGRPASAGAFVFVPTSATAVVPCQRQKRPQSAGAAYPLTGWHDDPIRTEWNMSMASGDTPHMAWQRQTASEFKANAAGQGGNKVKSLLRPASAPARSREDRCGAQAPRPSSAAGKGAVQRYEAEIQKPGVGRNDQWRRASSRGRIEAASKETKKCAKLNKQVMTQKLCLM